MGAGGRLGGVDWWAAGRMRFFGVDLGWADWVLLARAVWSGGLAIVFAD